MISPRRRRALQALIERGATPGEREAARVALAKADAADKATAPPSGPRVRSAGFTITVEEMRSGFTVTFDDWRKHEERQREAWRQHEQQRQAWETLFRQAPPSEPFGFSSEPRFRGQDIPRPGQPRSEPRPCTFMYTAEMVEDHLSPTDDQTFLVRDLKPSEGPEYKTKGTPVILLVGKAEFGARCVHWEQQNPGGPILAYFERLTCAGRLEAAGTIDGDLLVEMTAARATALARGLELFLVTHGGRTWICRCLGPDEGGGRFAKVDRGPLG